MDLHDFTKAQKTSQPMLFWQQWMEVRSFSPSPHTQCHVTGRSGALLGVCCLDETTWCIICLMSTSSCKWNVDSGSLVSNISSLSVRLDTKNLHLNPVPWKNWTMFLARVKFLGIQDKDEYYCEDCFCAAWIKQEQTTLYFPVSASAIWPTHWVGNLSEYPS